MRQLARESSSSSQQDEKQSSSSSSDVGSGGGAESKYASLSPDARGGKRIGVKMTRPAWALSKDAADEKSEEKISEEDAELIEFAKGLDFDRYIDDLEVQTMMEKVQKRITELERDVVDERQREAEHDSRRQDMKLQSKVGSS